MPSKLTLHNHAINVISIIQHRIKIFKCLSVLESLLPSLWGPASLHLQWTVTLSVHSPKSLLLSCCFFRPCSSLQSPCLAPPLEDEFACAPTFARPRPTVNKHIAQGDKMREDRKHDAMSSPDSLDSTQNTLQLHVMNVLHIIPTLHCTDRCIRLTELLMM